MQHNQGNYDASGRQFTFNVSPTQRQPTGGVAPGGGGDQFYRVRGGGPAPLSTTGQGHPTNGHPQNQGQNGGGYSYSVQQGGQNPNPNPNPNPNQYYPQQQQVQQPSTATGYYSVGGDGQQRYTDMAGQQQGAVSAGGTRGGAPQRQMPMPTSNSVSSSGSMNRPNIPASHSSHSSTQQRVSASGRGHGQAQSASPNHQHPPNKRQKPLDEEEGSDAEYYDDDGDQDDFTVGAPDPSGRIARAPGACAPCKHLKIKCVFESRRSPACKNCVKRNKPCTIPERRPRKAPPKREELIKSIRDKDALIGQLIEQLEARKSSMAPVSLSLTSDPTSPSDPSHTALQLEATAAAESSTTTTDPVAKEAIHKAVLQREKELQEWLKKAKATIEKSNAMDFGLLGGTANVVLGDEEDEWEDEIIDGSDYGFESPGDGEGSEEVDLVASPVTSTTQGAGSAGGGGGGAGAGGRVNLRRGASLVSSQSRKSGSMSTNPNYNGGNYNGGNGGNPSNANKASALRGDAPLGFIAKMGKTLGRRRSSGRSRESSPRYGPGGGGGAGTGSGWTGSEGVGTPTPGADGNGNGSGSGEDVEEGLGVSNPEFFVPSEKPYNLRDGEKLELPPILAKNIIGPKEVKELFDVYFDCMNLSTCILDPKLYTPEKTLYRSPFLFTVVCAIAARYHPSRTTLYPILMNFARLAAGTAIISGRKSLEACQAYILMSLYPIPARRWSEDRSWMYLGCAIRMATDLNLHHPPVLEGGEAAVTISTIMDTEWQSREILNRTRCWLGCFNADKAMSTQFGKPTTLREDWMFPLLQRNMSEGNPEWWCPTPFGWKFDIHLCAYSALLREISNFHEQVYSDPTNPTGLNEKIPFEELTYEFDNRIENMAKEWFHRVDTHMDKEDPQCVFRKGLLQLEFFYNQLVALSFGFQHAFRGGTIHKDNTFLQRCYRAACRVVRIVVDELGPQKYMRYCPESHYIFSTFASAFLLKLLRPKFSALLEVQQHHEILELVERLAITLNGIAMDDRHAPKLYSRFLQGLLKQAKKILARGSNASSASSPASTANVNRSSASPAMHAQEFSPSVSGNMGMGGNMAPGMGGMYMQPNMGSPSQITAPYGFSGGDMAAQAGKITGQGAQFGAGGGAQGMFGFGGDTGASFDMEGVQNTLPQNSWPHPAPAPGTDADTLMHMSLFSDSFWNEGLMPGFSWSDSTAAHHGDNIVRNDYTMVPPDIQVSMDNAAPQGYPAMSGMNSSGGAPMSGQTGGYYPQSNPMQAFPIQQQQQQQQQQTPYQY